MEPKTPPMDYMDRSRLLTIIGVLLLLGGVAIGLLGPVEMYSFYLFSEGGRFHYQGFGFGSFMFDNIASQIIGYYLIAVIHMPGLHHMGNLTTTTLGLVGHSNFVRRFHVLNGNDILQIQLFQHHIRTGISTKGNGNLGWNTITRLSFFPSGRNTFIHNPGNCITIKKTFQKSYKDLNPKTRNSAYHIQVEWTRMQ